MNHTGNTNFIIYPDTSITTTGSAPVIKIEVDTLKLDVEKPVIKTIPEIPRRFKRTNTTIKSKEKIFIPSSEDSVQFNLISRSIKGQGVIQNTVVNDFLYPVLRGDKQWISSVVDSQVDSTQVTSLKSERVELQPDSTIVSDRDFVVFDSLDRETDVDSFIISKSEEEILPPPKPKGGKDTIEVLASQEKLVILQNHSKDVVTGLLILSVAIVGVIRMTNNKYLRELFSSVLFGQYARKIQKTTNVRNQKAAFVLNALFLFNASIFIYQFVSYYKINTPVNQSLLLIPLSMGIVFSFGLIKGMLYLFVGFVFGSEKETRDYLFFSVLHNKIFALIILPVILVVPYIERQMLPILFNIGFGSFILLYFMQLFRGITIILKNTASLFYLFLYLCALEILPLIIMYSILISWA